MTGLEKRNLPISFFWEHCGTTYLTSIFSRQSVSPRNFLPVNSGRYVKVSEDNKKLMWPTFPFHCGNYTLNNFKYADKEVIKIRDLKLSTVPERQYDSKKVAFDFTTSVSITWFEHEPDEFDDLFVSIDKLPQLYDLAKFKF